VPDVRVPKLDEHGGRSIVKTAFEVAMIALGVFLGLAGEQWRETRHHRELAEQSLRAFKTEITANRRAVAAVKDYHADRLKELRAYFDAKPADRKNVSIHLTKSANPAYVERTAWQLAMATQSLTYIEPELAYSLSNVYGVQGSIEGETQGFVQGMFAGMFARPLSQDTDGFFAALLAYFGDMSLSEPKLLGLYDDALEKIDKDLK
jgi:hypothetical protein